MFKRPNANDPKSTRYKFRKKRFERIEVLIRSLLEDQDEIKIIDIGGRRDYWSYLSSDLRPKVEISLVNFENELTDFKETVDGLRFILEVGDGTSLPQYKDQSFDIAHSNSVIEHVGSMKNMASFAKETRRIGKTYYVQAPYLWFPLEPHFGVPFLHWLPGPTRAQLTHRFSVGFSDKIEDYKEALAEADFINLVDKTLMKKLFPDAVLHYEKFMFMSKSLIMIKPKMDVSYGGDEELPMAAE